jgi:hypothetical protein
MHRKPKRPLRSERVIYTPYITKNGQRIYANAYGLKAFKFVVSN